MFSGIAAGTCVHGRKFSAGGLSMKSVLIGEATRSNWFMGVRAENLLDGAGHVDLRVEGAVFD